MNQEFEEYLQQLRDGSGWDFPLTVSMGFSFIEKKEFEAFSRLISILKLHLMR